MTYYAIHDWHVVSNVIVADSQEIAEQITGLNALETTGQPWIDWTYVDSQWRPPQPYPSWTWDGNAWVAPVPMPDEGGPWVWDEATKSWVEG